MREPTGTAVHASRTGGGGRGGWRGFIVATIAAPVMAVLAPLGTHAIGFLPRLAYWLLLMEAGALIGLGISLLVERRGWLRTRPPAQGGLVALLIAVPLTLLVILVSKLFFGRNMFEPMAMLILFGIVLMISLIITAITYALDRGAQAGVPAAVDEAGEAWARFAERLPLPMRGSALLALEAEDHYLRVHLAGGQSVLILLRLGDAIAELEAVPGARTHRSWWVAKAAVRRIARGDGRATLTLADGIEAPVSRSYYKTLAEAGWFVG